MSMTVSDRFWSKVDVRGEDECWLWQASNTKGYGQFGYNGQVVRSHKVAWMLTNGDIPDGMLVMHICPNSLCVNPNHLMLGNARDNVGETVNRERSRYAAKDVDYDPELQSPFQYTIEPGPYEHRAGKWRGKADFELRNSDTVILGGYGLKIYVQDGLLMVKLLSEDIDAIQFNRGTHKLRHVVIYSHGGFLTLDAIEWLCEQGITLYLLDWRGNFLQTLSPRNNRSAKLAYLQYKAYESGLAIDIARELVYYKASQQAQVLTGLTGQPQMDLEIIGNELSRIKDVETLRLYEASCAFKYWSYFVGLPIKWEYRDVKHLPEHWYSISNRVSAISTYKNASQATNPFHSTLNFAYALLEGQVLEAINIAGLAPEVGYLHTSEGEGNQLAWDIMECFRPVVDTMILDLFQGTTFHRGDFIQWHSGETRLNDELKRYVLAECRIDNKAIDVQVNWLKKLLES